MNKRWYACALTVIIVGCGSDDGDNKDAGGDTSQSVWRSCDDLKAGFSGQAPTPASGCEAVPKAKETGCTVPWTGAKVGASSFTCNRCPAGDPLVQGRWRAIDGKTEDPSVAMADDFREVLEIDGNTWHMRKKVRDENGVFQEVIVDGWYWCSDAAELKSAKLVYEVLNVNGSAFFGWEKSYLFTAYFLTNGPDLMAWSMDVGFEEQKIGDLIYCRVGSEIDGVPCLDPFPETSK